MTQKKFKLADPKALLPGTVSKTYTSVLHQKRFPSNSTAVGAVPKSGPPPGDHDFDGSQSGLLPKEQLVGAPGGQLLPQQSARPAGPPLWPAQPVAPTA